MLRAGASAETSWSWGLAEWLRAPVANFGEEIVEGELIVEFCEDITRLVF